MKFFFIRIYILFCFFTIFIASSDTFAKDNKIKYTDNDISNYFVGVLSSKNEDNEKAFKHLKKVKSLKNNHTQFNIEYIRTLVLLDKFQEAFTFSESIWEEDELFFSADLLIGLNYFLKKDYELYALKKHVRSLSRQNGKWQCACATSGGHLSLATTLAELKVGNSRQSKKRQRWRQRLLRFHTL